MNFTLNFDDRTYNLTAFEVEWDVFQGMMDPNYWPTAQPPTYFNKFTSVLNGNGTVLRLFDVFKPTWERLRRAGVDVVSPSVPCVTVSIDNVDTSLYYHYEYDHTNPNELDVELYYPSGYQSQTFTFNYARGETTYDGDLHSIYCVVNHITDCPDATYDGCHWFAIGALNAYYVYQSAETTTTLSPPTWIPVSTTTASKVGKHITELLSADPATRSADPYSIWDYSYTNGFGYQSSIYPQPGGAGFINALEFNDATAIEIKVNNIDLDDIIDDDTTPDNDYTNSNNWSTSNWREPSDFISFPAEIVNDCLSYGFIHAYYLTPAAALDLSDYLLTDAFIQNVKKLFANPIDYIMGLALLPVIPENLVDDTIVIGGVDTEINAARLTKQFQYFDCGSIEVKEKWGGFPDYAPGTKCALWLPFCGLVSINVEDIMDGQITLKYRVDLLTGECVAMLLCDTARDLNGIVYHFHGMMAVENPITNADYSQKIQSVINGIGNVVGAVTSGAGGNVGGAVTGAISGGTSLIEGIASKPIIQRSGAVSGTAGVMDVLVPYLIIDRPVQALPSTYQKLNGFSSCQGGKLSQFSGYVEIGAIDLSGVKCTEDEKEEILNDLQSGVFI